MILGWCLFSLGLFVRLFGPGLAIRLVLYVLATLLGYALLHVLALKHQLLINSSSQVLGGLDNRLDSEPSRTATLN